VEGWFARAFVEALCAAIGEGWPAHAAMKVEADPVAIATAVAVPLALIIHELLANSIEHGLAYGPGEVGVELCRHGNGLALTVRDSGDSWDLSEGAGPASGFSPVGGLSLVRGMSSQIGGTFEITTGNGTWCVVRWPSNGGRQRE
jgi:two-component sensor histidine kinase